MVRSPGISSGTGETVTDTDTTDDESDSTGDSTQDTAQTTDTTDNAPERNPASTKTGPAIDAGDSGTNQDTSDKPDAGDSPLNVSTGDSGSSSVDSFPTPEEVNQEVADADTTQQDTDLSNTGSGNSSTANPGSQQTGPADTGTEGGSFDPKEVFTAENRGANAQLEGRAPGGGVTVPSGVDLSDQQLRKQAAKATSGVQASQLEVLQGKDGRVIVYAESQTQEKGEATTQALPDRRTVEVSETGTAGDVQITRDATQRTIDNSQISSIDLGENNAVRVPREPTTETLLAGTNTSSPNQSGATPAPTTEQQPTENIPLSESQRQSIESSLENQTNADLSRADYQVTVNDEGKLVATLTDEGQETVEVQNTPGRNIPVVGGILTTGTRVRAEYRDVTQPAADAFYNTVPTGSDILGLVGAAAPAAAAEPTPVGEIGLGGLVAGAAAVGIGSQVGGQVAGEDPTAQTDIAIPERDKRRQGEIQQGETNPNELEPGETQTTELEVPEDRTTVAPEELGVPREAVQEGDAEITGPEGTEITDDGEIVIPAGTTAVAKEKRYEDEEEEAEDEEDEEEDQEEEEDRVVVNVPEEFVPDEEVTIGGEGATEPVEETETRTEESESEEESDEPVEDILNLPRQGTQEDDAAPDGTQADEDFAEDQPTSGDATQPATPERDKGTDSTFPGAIGGGGTDVPTLPPLLDEEQDTAQTGAGGTPQPTVPGLGEDEDQQQGQPEAETPVQQPGEVPGQVPGQIQPPAQDTPPLQQPRQAQVPRQAQGQGVGEAVETGTGEGLGTQVVQARVNVQEQQQVPQTPTNQRRRTRLPDLNRDEDDEEDEFGLFGVSNPYGFDFRNPLTGGVLETDVTPGGDGNDNTPTLDDLF